MRKPIDSVRPFPWKGQTWMIDNYSGGPGPNNFSSSNVSLQSDGIHMKINKRNGKWYCASIQSILPVSYGTYKCTYKGRTDLLDPEIVLAMYHYGHEDGVNEIDIEISRWNDSKANPLNYTVYPPISGPNKHLELAMAQMSNLSTHRYTWMDDHVTFLSQQGVRTLGDMSNIIQSASIPISPNIPMPIRFNFWLYDGAIKGTLDGKGAEIVITDFLFSPL